MAKRKRNSTTSIETPTSSGKRRREEVETTPHPHGDIDYDREYKLRAIVEEKGDRYLIDWEPDSETGETFARTWEPKANANQLAVEEWEERKRATAASAGPSAVPVKRGRGRPRKTLPAADPSTPAPAKRPRGRPRKVIPDSSSTAPSPALDRSAGPAPAPSSSADDTEPLPEIEESDTENPLIVDEDFSRFEDAALHVQPSDPPSSYQAGAYERLSSQTSSKKSSSQNYTSSISASQPVTGARQEFQHQSSAPQPQSQPVSTQSGRGASLVIPDSQSQQASYESSSFKGFSPRPESQRASTGRSQAFSGEEHPPEAESPSRHRASTGASIAPDPVTPSQAVQNADAVAGAVQEEDRPTAAPIGISNDDERTSREKSSATQFVQQEGEEGVLSDRPKEPVTSLAQHPTQTSAANPTKSIVISPAAQSQSNKSRYFRWTDFKGSKDTPATSSNQASAENNFTQAQRPEETRSAAASIDSIEEQLQQELSQSLAVERHTASSKPNSSEEESAASNKSQAQPSGLDGTDAHRPIVVSSNEESDQSTLGSLQLFTQSSLAPDFQPPPAGQRPVPSSAVQHPTPAANRVSQQLSTADSRSDFSPLWPSGYRQSESSHQEVPPPRQASSHQEQSLHQEESSHQEEPSQKDNSSTQSSVPFLTQLPRARNKQATSRADPSTTVPKTSRRVATNVSDETPDSSPFPAVPSQSLGHIGESIPVQPHTPEDMAKTPSPQEPMASSITAPANQSDLPKGGPKLAREENGRLQVPNEQPASALPPSIGAEVAAAQRAARLSIPPEGARSPSTVPAHEPTPDVTREEMNTSERYDTLLPQAQSSSSRADAHHLNGSSQAERSSKTPAETEKDPESANVHIVPVGLFGMQRDSYLNDLYYQQSVIKEFLGESNPSQHLLRQADVLFQRLRNTVMHPDLNNSEALTQASEPEIQAQWDCDSSAKFRFVREFFKLQADRDMHVALVVRGRQVSEMMERHLRGTHIPYKTSYTSEHQDEGTNKSGPRATIVDLDRAAEQVESAHIVIALDGLTTHQDPVIRALRQHSRQPNMDWANNWAGLYILVAPRTIEHIERFIVPSLSGKARARTLLTAIDRFRDDFTRKINGQSQLSFLKQAAQDVGDYLDDPEMEWPLEDLEIIENLDSQTDSEMTSGQEHQSSSAQDGTSAKRPLESSEVEMSSGEVVKRQRLDSDAPPMPATINPQDMDITHVSDSLGKGTQSNLLDNDDPHAPIGPSALERRLQEALDEQQNRLDEHVKAMEDLQYRYEEQRVELVEIKKRGDTATKAAAAYAERLTITENNNSVLRAERTALKEQLAEANRRLLVHSVPERAEFEKLRLATEQLKLEKEKAEKREQAAQRELQYSRDTFQNYSNQTRDLASEKAELEKQVAELSVVASGEAARAREISQKNHYKAMQKEMVKLQLQLKSHERSLKQKDEEIARLKEATRGRMGTRQSSVPRSPRVSSPIKRGGAGSRQASPAAGDVRGGRGGGHPLRRSD